jgi:hypothetical protein
MEPTSSAPRPSGEMGPLPGGSEAPRFPAGTPEVAPQKAPEAQPERGASQEQRTNSSGGDPAFAAQQIALPQIPVPAPAQPAPATTVHDDTNPAAAADDDLIEKEWVERAKKIVASTKSDPYLQEQQVSKLQADYLKKRYGKEVKLPTE